MKNVAIAAATPAGNLDEANAILGKVVEPKIRWNVGSLVGAAISNLTARLTVIILKLGQAFGFCAECVGQGRRF